MFRNPAALLALGLLALPVVIHMLARMSGPRLRFASIRFIPRSVASRFRLLKVHRWPLLIMRLFVSGLVVLAVSGPEVAWTGESRSALILLDESMSMRGEAIRESVLRKAHEQISDLAERDRIALAGFGLCPRLLCDFTTDRSLIEQALAGYSPGYTEADFGAALVWAEERLNSQPSRRRLVVISDLQATNITAMRQAELSVEPRVIRVDRTEQANASLSEVAVRSFGGRVEVASSLLLSEGDRTEIKPLSIRTGPLSGGETTASYPGASLHFRPVGDSVIAGRLTADADGEFSADDQRFFAARLPARGDVLVVQPLTTTGGHALYVEKALRASLHQVTDVNPVSVSDQMPGDMDSLRRHRAVICPARAIDKNNVDAVREYAREGGIIIVTLGIEDGPLPERLFDSVSVTSLDQPQATGLLVPAFAGRDLLASYADVRFRAAHSVSAAIGDVALRYTNGDIASVRIVSGRGSLVLLGFGLSGKDTTLVRSALFPDFIEWLIEGAGAKGVAEFAAGQVPVASLLGGATRLTQIYSADGRALDQEIAIGNRSLDEPGVYRVERASGVTVLAINVPASESRLAQASEQDFLHRLTVKGAGARLPAAGRYPEADGAIGLWWVIAVAALALSLIELACCSLGSRAEVAQK
ncbi:MAG TPA: VWA domain-containing protein [Blastocatellia bacterium]|nr:VWA domain-containing protein [Blastocatellia bacterium]